MCSSDPIVDVRAELIQAGVLREGGGLQAPSPRASVQQDAEAFTACAREILREFGRERSLALALDSGTDRRVAAALFVALGG